MIDLRQVVNEVPFAIYTCDEAGYLTFYNVAAAALWGRQPQVGKDKWCGSWKMFSPEGLPLPSDRSPIAQAIKNGAAYENHVTIQRPDGTFRQLKAFAGPLFGPTGALIGAYNTLIDITESHDHTRNAVLSAIVESSDDAIISKNLNGIIQSWNEGARRIFGYTEKEAVGRSILMLIPPSRQQEEDLILGSIKRGERINHFETVRLGKDGREIPISLTVSPIKDADGLVVGASKVARDITDRNDAVTKREMLAAIVESSDDAIISKRLDGTITSWNSGAEGIFGYKEAEAVGQPITMLIPQSRLGEEQFIIEQISQGKKVDHFTTKRLHKDGYEIDVSLTISPMRNVAGEVVGASKIARDITEQVRSQNLISKYAQNLKTLNDIGKLISEKMDVQVILQRVTDATTQLTGAAFGAFFYNTVNDRGESYMLYTLSGAPRSAFEQFGMPRATEVFRPTFAGQGVVRVDDITKDPRYGHNAPHQGMPKGHLPVVSYLAVPVISESGKVIGGLFFGHPDAGVFTQDHEEMVSNIAAQTAIAIDNSRLFEEVKTLSSRKDEFIALAGHELKTPLTSIKGYLQVLAKGKRSDLEERFFNKSLRQIEKLNMLIEDMLNMSRIEAGKLELTVEAFDLTELLLDVIDTFQHTEGTHEIVKDIPEKPVIIEGDHQRLEQALINLISNAIKYSPKADRIKVTLEVEDGLATVRIQDYGIGLTPQQQQKIFSRFYRAEGLQGISGLGLGLYLTKEILDRHNAGLLVSSEFGKGSVFAFSVPIAEL